MSSHWLVGVLALLSALGLACSDSQPAEVARAATPSPTLTTVAALGTPAPEPTDTPTPTPEPTETPTATPEPAATATPTPTATATPMPTNTPTPTATSTATPTLTPTPTPVPIALAGRGQQASSKFDLNEGLTVFSMTHTGQSNFAIWLMDSQGNSVDLLVNEIGPFDGSKAVGVRRTGTYLLDVSADMDWTVLITQPPASTDLEPPFTLAGRGQQASALFNLTSGLTMFRMEHDGQSNFAIWLMDSRGNSVDLLVNEIGPFDGSIAVGIRQPGAFLLDISADGEWSVVVEQ